MPELPEVETIRLGLEKYIVGKKIVGVEVRLKKILQGETLKIVGAKFKKIRRFGKALSLDLDNEYSIAVHVKMTGQLIAKVPEVQKVPKVSKALVGELPNKFTHVIFRLDKGVLYYNDVRQFGWLKIIQTAKIKDQNFLKNLGPEPFVGQTSSGQAFLTLEKFREIIRNKSVSIKVLLMDQKRIAGVGNIYANEALFLAGIHPTRKAMMLSSHEARKLYQAIIKVLKLGLKYGGASENTFVNALGEKGEYQNYFSVYGQANKPCKNCGNIVKRIILGGRGTFYCETCQY